MYRPSPIRFLRDYTTFGGETDFFSGMLLPIGGIAVTLASFRLATLEFSFSRDHIIGLSVLGILGGLIALVYLLSDAGQYTVEERFHTWTGTAKATVSHLLISGVAVLALYLVLAAAIVDIPLGLPAPYESLFGIAVVVIAAVPLAAANRRHLGQTYPRIAEIEDAFEQETDLSLVNIENEIIGIGHIERSETSRILNAVRDRENAVLVGDGGVGKSGILKKVATCVDTLVLFIDTTRFPGLQSQSELGDRLGIPSGIKQAIHQLRLETSLVVIVDQLDDIGGTEGRVFQEFILTVAAMENVSVVFACREHDLQTRTEYELLRNSDAFTTEAHVARLNRPEVAEYIKDLLGVSPGDELIEVGRNIQYLDAIADLADDDIDLSNISGKAALWDKYRESLEQEDQPGDDDRRGGRVLQQAVKYAREATEDGSNIFTVPTDEQWTDTQLINTGVIVTAQDEPGTRRHRFRHPDFQTYLYAWDAVEDGETIQAVTQRLDDRLGKDVFRWMLALYLRNETTAPKQLPDLAGALATSEYAQEFLEDVFDEEEIGYYATTVILDEIKTWNASENPALAATVLDKLSDHEELYRYFLDDTTDTSWVYQLQERGAFKEPDNILIGFLGDLAPNHPEAVSDVLDTIMAADSRSQALVISVLRELPATEAAEHVDLVREFLTEVDQRNDQRTFEAVQLTEELITRGHVDAGLVLLEVLLAPRIFGEEQTRPQSIADLHFLSSTLEDTLEPIVTDAPEQGIELVESQLRAAVECEADLKDRDVDTIAGFYQSPIASAEFDQPGYLHLRGLLTGTLREATELWLDDASAETRREVIQEYLRDITLFRRLGFHLLNRYDESYPELLRQELLNASNYTETWTKSDFFRLLRDSFETLALPEQEQVTEIILSVPPQESLEERAEEWGEHTEDQSVAELRERYIDDWVRERLWLIREHLPQDAADRLAELQEKYDDEPRDLVSDSGIKGGFVSEESPKPVDELAAMDPDDFLHYLVDWEPDEDDLDWEELESGGLREINQRGLAEAAAEVIMREPSRYEAQIPELRKADAIYTRELLGSLREELDEHPEAFEEEFNWTPVFALCEDVAANPNDWDKSARIGVVRLLRTAYSTDTHAYMLDYAATAKDLFFELLDDPDPSPSRDRPPEGHAGHQNPMHVALNAVRPIAVDGLIIYAVRLAKRRKYEGYAEEQESGFEPAVRDQLLAMMEDEALAVRAIFGRRLHYLWYLDHEFVLDNLQTLFPRSQSTKDKNRFMAAWDAYVAANIMHEDLFPRLRPCYFHGIDLHAADENTVTQNAQEGLAHHVLSAYLFDFEGLDQSDSLVTYLYDRDDHELDRQIAWRLWRSGKDNAEIREKWEKVRRLWELRLDQVDDVEAYADEMQWFIEWLPLIEDRVSLEEVEPLLRDSLPFTTQNRRMWQTVESYLAGQAEESPEKAIRLYDELMALESRPKSARFRDETAALLRPGLDVDPETRTIALDIAEQFAEEGEERARGFLDRHT